MKHKQEAILEESQSFLWIWVTLEWPMSWRRNKDGFPVPQIWRARLKRNPAADPTTNCHTLGDTWPCTGNGWKRGADWACTGDLLEQRILARAKEGISLSQNCSRLDFSSVNSYLLVLNSFLLLQFLCNYVWIFKIEAKGSRVHFLSLIWSVSSWHPACMLHILVSWQLWANRYFFLNLLWLIFNCKAVILI